MNAPASSSLPTSLYTAAQVRTVERLAIEATGIDSFALMCRAGRAAFTVLCQIWPALLSDKRQLHVFCGAGNNGGDGYVIAYLAKQQGLAVTVVALTAPDTLQGAAKTAYQQCQAAGVAIALFADHSVIDGDIIVDALLGTGLRGTVSSTYRTAIARINAAGVPVLAVDIPSGLCADTGAVLGVAVNATVTVTFIGMKPGLLTAMGPDVSGQRVFAGLEVPPTVYAKVPAAGQRLHQAQFTGLLAPRPRHAHKGLYGHVLLIGGNQGMPGAIIMAAEAALACGAGKVTVATRAEHLTALAVRRPEVMAVAVNSEQDVSQLAHGKDVLVVGPGLGQDDWARRLLTAALTTACPVVLDADALRLLAQHPELSRRCSSPKIVTPHPGEAAHLLGCRTSAVQQNRLQAASALQQQLQAVVVLKGVGTLIASAQGIQLCADGNPGMAVAGMGDVLSGVIAALWGQGLQPEQAAAMAVWLHATAADQLAAQQGQIGLLATDLIPAIRRQLWQLYNSALIA